MTKDELTKLRQERRGQRLNIGDRVKAYDRKGNLLYGGKTAVIAEKALLVENEYYFGIYVEGVTDVKRDGSGKSIGYTSFFAPFYAEDLELVKEPNDKRDSEVDETAELKRVKANCKELYEAGMNFCRAILGEDAAKEPKPKFKVGDLVIVMPGENSNIKFAGTIRAIHGDTAEVSIGSTLSILPLEKLFPARRLAEDIAEEEKRIAEETNRETDIMSNGMLCGVEEQGTEPQPQQGLIDHLFYRVKALEEDVERIKKKQ